ncbi:MAG TPA: alpha-glucan family phosphorylase, partial [Myxococcota bacterium]|nr:alpha-glucan family phosphorylase [Myxococcota bacterium]
MAQEFPATHVGEPVVAYFSMEIGLEPSIPTYAGGLGVLAGDTLRAAADLEVPLVAVTLLHRAGYFHQRIDAEGRQREEPVSWPLDDFLEPLAARARIELFGRSVHLACWRYRVRGVDGFEVPVYLLDTDLPENEPSDRRLTDRLYGGDEAYRLCQEAVLGLGGIAMLRALGHGEIARYHQNEGHAALIVLALLEQRVGDEPVANAIAQQHVDAVRDVCVFTTHTPVPAGHDQFAPGLVERVLGPQRAQRLGLFTHRPELNMTDLALRGSGYVNGVAMSHWEVSRDLFPDYKVHAITNGVHVRTWASPPFQTLFDRWLPDWRRDALSLRYAVRIPCGEIWSAHQEAKRALVEAVNRESNAGFDANVLTLGFARRATAYKRTNLVLADLERLRKISAEQGRLQLVFAGKAHPRDAAGKELIHALHQARDALRGHVGVAFLANHDMALARLLCAGSDVWLNTPLPPLEASGTSGMKAAVNGVPSLSILDGWFVEGHVEGHTGWSIGDEPCARAVHRPEDDAADARALYEKLEQVVVPCFYRTPERFQRVMRSTI